MWANWILYWSVFVLHVIHSKRVRCWQKRMNRHLSISRRRMNALSSMIKKQQQQQQQQHRENKWLNISINHYAYMFHIWWCQRHTYTHAFIKLTEKERKRERENSIISVKYIGNCLLNYACMTEPFDGIVVAYATYAQHTKLQMCILYIWIYAYENGMLYRFDRA